MTEVTDSATPFEEPWQIRLFALARALVDQGLVADAELRSSLSGAIASQPDRPYWESYLEALEHLTAGRGVPQN